MQNANVMRCLHLIPLLSAFVLVAGDSLAETASQADISTATAGPQWMSYERGERYERLLDIGSVYRTNKGQDALLVTVMRALDSPDRVGGVKYVVKKVISCEKRSAVVLSSFGFDGSHQRLSRRIFVDSVAEALVYLRKPASLPYDAQADEVAFEEKLCSKLLQLEDAGKVKAVATSAGGERLYRCVSTSGQTEYKFQDLSGPDVACESRQSRGKEARPTTREGVPRSAAPQGSSFAEPLSIPRNLDCPSTTTLHITSSGYSGIINIELREGVRPGSKIVAVRTIHTDGTVELKNVCPGRYFFAFGTTDRDEVSVTRYFDVTNNGSQYNNPVIRVYYARSSADGSQRVGTAKKNAL